MPKHPNHEFCERQRVARSGGRRRPGCSTAWLIRRLVRRFVACGRNLRLALQPRQLAQAFARQASGSSNVNQASPAGHGLNRSKFQQRQQHVVQPRGPSAKFRYRFVIIGCRLKPSLPRAGLLLPALFVG